MVGISVLIWFLLFSPVTGQKEDENEDNVMNISPTSTTSDRTYTGIRSLTTTSTTSDRTYTDKRFPTTTTSDRTYTGKRSITTTSTTSDRTYTGKRSITTTSTTSDRTYTGKRSITTTSTTSDRTYTGKRSHTSRSTDDSYRTFTAKTYRPTYRSTTEEYTGTYTAYRHRTTTTSTATPTSTSTATPTSTPTSTPNDSSTSCSQSRETWDYEGELGTENWGKNYPACKGEFQSPIEIIEKDIMIGPNKLMLFINYDALPRSMTMKNDGNALIITGNWDSSAITPTVQFNGKNYMFQSLYFHWGKNANDGSEHILYREKWAMEMHLLHKSSNNELLVVGMVAMICDASFISPGLSKISHELAKIQDVGKCIPIYNLALDELVYITEVWNDFYWYKGSLTMPPCTENVDWFLGNALYCITEKQIEEFRKLNNTNGGTISGNVRKEQKMNGRFVQRMRQAMPSRSFSVRESRQYGLATLYVTSTLILFVAI